MSKAKVLILDDADRWVGEFRLKLEEAGFDCLYSTTGEDALNKIKQDFHHTIKVVLTDELLLVDGLEGGEKQRFQGRDVRARVYKERPDIKFIVISDLPYKEAKKQTDVDRGMQIAVQLTADLSQGQGVVAMLDKLSLDPDNPILRQAKYQWLFATIREMIGEPKAPVKPGIFIGLGLPQAQYTQLMMTVGSAEKSGIRLHEYFEKINPANAARKRDVDKFLREKVLGQGVKEFLQALPTKKKEKETMLAQVKVRLDRVLIQKSNSSRLSQRFIEVGSSDFRILMILAWRAERGDEVIIREADYPYQKRQAKPTVGPGLVGLGEHSRQQAISDPYRTITDLYADEEDNSDQLTVEDYQREQKVTEDITYGYSKGSGRRERIAEVSPSRSVNPLKTPVCRLNKYLQEEKIGLLQSVTSNHLVNGEQKVETCYAPSFKTGIMIYPIDLD